MKNLILYTTKSGAAKECAELLAERLECSAYDMSQITSEIELSEYDTIIFGTGVRMGRIYKPAQIFLQKNRNLLLEKKMGIFLCNAYPDTFQKTIETNFPKELAEHAVCIKSFGGKPPFTKPLNTSWMNSNNINDFLEEVCNQSK